MPLPKYLKQYFWDTEFSKIDIRKSKKFIVARILEFGDQKSLKWAMNKYQPEVFKNVLQNSRELSLRSANFWAIYFNINKNKVKCLQKPYLKQRQTVWPY